MKVLLIDHHTLFREGLRCLLNHLPEGVDEILEAGNFPDGLAIAGQHPDLNLALLELKTPGCGGAIAIKIFRQRYPKIPVIVLTSEEDSNIMNKSLNCGASGFVCKSSSAAMFMSTLNLVLSGNIRLPQQFLPQHSTHTENKKFGNHHFSLNTNEYSLTSRQMQVLRYMIAGLSNKEIAGTINIAEGTVKAHISAIYHILGVNNRIEAMRAAKQFGLDSISPTIFEPESGNYRVMQR
jgi:DNA-binding NarL/FixJ family response regulator